MDSFLPSHGHEPAQPSRHPAGKTQGGEKIVQGVVGVVQYEGISVMSLVSGITLKEKENRTQNLSLEEARNTSFQSNVSVLEGTSTTLQAKTG